MGGVNIPELIQTKATELGLKATRYPEQWTIRDAETSTVLGFPTDAEALGHLSYLDGIRFAVTFSKERAKPERKTSVPSRMQICLRSLLDFATGEWQPEPDDLTSTIEAAQKILDNPTG